MKIQYMSDLHLELADNSRYIKNMGFPVTGDVLVLAGDIFYLNNTIPPLAKFWKWASSNYNFRQTRFDGKRLTIEDYNYMHWFCFGFIKKSVAESTAKHIVVVTHHLPTLKVVAVQHQGAYNNGADSKLIKTNGYACYSPNRILLPYRHKKYTETSLPRNVFYTSLYT